MKFKQSSSLGLSSAQDVRFSCSEDGAWLQVTVIILLDPEDVCDHLTNRNPQPQYVLLQHFLSHLMLFHKIIFISPGIFLLPFVSPLKSSFFPKLFQEQSQLLCGGWLQIAWDFSLQEILVVTQCWTLINSDTDLMDNYLWNAFWDTHFQSLKK